MASSWNVPDHVDPALIVDFDIYRPAALQQGLQEAWQVLTSAQPIVWSPHNGGHWIATRAEDIVMMQTDHERFSHRAFTIPRSSTPSLPIELDPPEHTPLRAIISPLFQPDVLRRADARGRQLANDLLDRLQPLGRCDFANDFARHLPIVIFLMLVDLPTDDREYLLGLADKRGRSPDAAERDRAKACIVAYIADAVAERREKPRDDFISRILQGRVDGRPLSDFEAENLLATVMSGGLDTVASMMSFVFLYLARHPEARATLRARPDLIVNAADELIRRHGLVATARLLTRDVDMHGAAMKAGEQIILPNSFVGLDATLFPDPWTVDIERKGAGRHAAFGNGPHRCPGANLARLEIRLVIEEWLARIPDFALDPDRSPAFGSGVVGTVNALPLVWEA